MACRPIWPRCWLLVSHPNGDHHPGGREKGVHSALVGAKRQLPFGSQILQTYAPMTSQCAAEAQYAVGNPAAGAKRARLDCRPRHPDVNTLAAAIASIGSAKRIVALVGAGISVSCGVPDFRSETGIYALAAEMGLALGDPQVRPPAICT